ncbi:hypothetical protein [Marinobacter fonticola]|uniref:hypothetical protein n=1 Tax=Marinobacter fonticola TaxID=2603215 RepID=UPI0011E872FA|nr:hypothetical protein [Marinobacter fonticola]
MQRVLTFVVPLRSPAASRNWERVLERLAETVRSIQSACDKTPGLGAVLVANDDAQLPELPGCFEVVRVDLPPPEVSVFKGEGSDEARRNAVWWDKGFKVATGMRHAHLAGSRFVMSVDADDFISQNIGELPAREPESDGWLVNEGWLLPAGARWGIALDDFHNWCGTYAIVRTDLLPLEAPVETLAPEIIKRLFGHHRELVPDLASKGKVLKPAGYLAAVYTVAHSESNFGRGSLLSSVLSPSKFFANPRKYVKRLLRLRYFARRDRAEFSVL